MDKINAVITGIGGYVPEDILTNEDISKMVDTTDEWIMTRVGIKERRILRGEGKGMSFMEIRAVNQLLEKTNTKPEEVEVLFTATTTPDHHFPTTSSIIAYHTGCKNAMTFDMQGACAGFLYALETGANYIRSGRYKKVVVVAGDKMTFNAAPPAGKGPQRRRRPGGNSKGHSRSCWQALYFEATAGESSPAPLGAFPAPAGGRFRIGFAEGSHPPGRRQTGDFAAAPDAHHPSSPGQPAPKGFGAPGWGQKYGLR